MNTVGVQPLSMFFRFDISLVGVKKDDTPRSTFREASRRGMMESDIETDAASAPDEGFDSWLNKKLSLLYGPVLREPIPDDLVRLIESQGSQKKDG